MVLAPWGVGRLGPLEGMCLFLEGSGYTGKLRAVLFALSLRFTVGAVNACGFFALGFKCPGKGGRVPLSLLSG